MVKDSKNQLAEERKEESETLPKSKAGRKKASKADFRLNTRNVFLTYPKCKMTKENALAKLTARLASNYTVVGHELHEDGSDHLHALMQLEKKMDSRNPSFFDLEDEDEDGNALNYHGNYQSARDCADVDTYVKKGGDFVTHGEFLGNTQSEIQKRAAQNKMLLTTSLPKLVDEGQVSLYSYQQIRQAKLLYSLDTMEVPDYMPKECIWIYGKTGIGKSRFVRDNHPGQFHMKMQNKWWDGYTGQSIVLLDDFDLQGQCLGHHLKIWADCYSFNAEVKGSIIKPSYTHFYITSQYLPKDIWCSGPDESKWDYELKEAIERRFKIMTIGSDGKTLIPLEY